MNSDPARMSLRAGLLSTCPSMIDPAGNKTCPLVETGSSNLARNDEPLGSLELTSPFKVSRAWVPSSDGETGGKGVISPVAGLVFRCKLVSSAFRIWGCGAAGSTFSAPGNFWCSSVIVCWAAHEALSEMTANM
jgi:hypothetical protein